MSWLRRLLNWIRGRPSTPPPVPTPTPIPTPVPTPPPVPPPVDPHIPPPAEPPAPIPTPPPPPPGDTRTARITIAGEPVTLHLNENGLVIPEKILLHAAVGTTVPLEIVVEMDPLDDPALYGQLVDTQAFRDNLPLPGTAELIMTSWPYTNPRLYVEDVRPVGTVEGRPGGFARVLENTATHKHVYLANITTGRLTFRIETGIVVRREGASYGLVRGHFVPKWGDTRTIWFEVWINHIGGDL